jgi:tetratricopeptide (TPR) repeat protein
MGNEYASRRAFDRAPECFARALEGPITAMMNMANVYRDLGRPGDAVVGLKPLLAVNPNNVQARQQMAQAYQSAVLSNPRFAEGHLFLAKLLLDLRRLDDAIESARRGLALQPAGEWAPLGHFVLADAFAAQGHREAAAREAGIAFRYESYHLNPGNSQTMQMAAYLPSSTRAQFVYDLDPRDLSTTNVITWVNQPNPYC